MIEPHPAVLILADTLSPRLTYVLDFVFKAKGQPYLLVTSAEVATATISIAYTKKPIDAKLNIQPSDLLIEDDIQDRWDIEFNAEKSEWTINDLSDEFAILFYFLSRYEEYIDKTRDQYGRYTAKQSLLFKANQLHRPWCDILAKKIWKDLGLDLNKLTDQFRTVLTYDIDIAWAYQYKPKWRSAANWVKSVSKPSHFNERLKVARNQLKDPYDSYDIIEKNAAKHTTLMFFLLGDYGPLDKNHHWKNKELQALINASKQFVELGIHPSFKSFLKPNIVKEECQRLASIASLSITNSRQHYLRFTLPDSYQVLLDAGITHDYSMGFAEHCGFRAGTSYPFPFFDLSKNMSTALTIVPFSVMDGTLKEYMKLSPEAAIEIVRDLKKNIQSVGGQFIPIWHNHSIGNQKEWQGWQAVYDECLK